ncbi:MAG: hypothetical protein AB7N76_06370 [Planctomycetota bacterium]
MKRSAWQLPLALAAAFAAGALLGPQAPRARAQEQPAKQDPAPPEQPPAPVEDPRLNALGISVMFEAYLACGYVGALADGLEAGLYDKDYVRVRLSAVSGGIKNNLEQLKGVRVGVELLPADHKALTTFEEVLTGIDRQAKALGAWAEKREPAQAQTFKQERAATWKKLTETLGIAQSAELFAPGGGKLGDAKGEAPKAPGGK